MRSLKSTLILWFFLFSLVPMLVVTYFLLDIFRDTYQKEVDFRLNAGFEDFVQLVRSGESRLWQAFEFFEHTTVTGVDSDRLKSVAEKFQLDAAAIYDGSGRLITSAQQDERGDWVAFPEPSAGRSGLVASQLKHLIKQRSALIVRAFQKRKLSFSMIKAMSKQKRIVEFTFDIRQKDLDLIRTKRQVDLAVLDRGERGILNNWSALPFKIISALQNKWGEVVPVILEGIPSLVLANKIAWGEDEFFVVTASSKVSWKEAISRVLFSLSLVLAGVVLILVVLVAYVSNNIISPLNQLVDVTKRAMNEGGVGIFHVGPYAEINALGQSISQLIQDVQQAQKNLLKKIEELKTTQALLVKSEKLSSLGLLVAGIAHEINNPVAYIYSNMSSLKKLFLKLTAYLDNLPESNPNLKKNIDNFESLINVMEKGLVRIKKIVEGLRFFARGSQPQKELVNLHQLVESALVLLSHKIKNTQIKVVLNVPKQLVVLCQPSEFSQVLLNLILNAIQAMGNMGTLTIRAVDDDSGTTIFVRDTGKGIAPEHQSKIFQPFFTTKAAGEGTGLGLSICYGIIEQHGGRIDFESEVGAGTEFRIWLPRV
ncbi:MAG: ATP-binding protein [Bdellovibrionaceae bacterium]|nr:ATP-binding protein [Pseudobdellovibrionaceae bacterium]MDW8190531.1 ATP-binding protein [Pseudobdellovibrionaceae bacterium]